MLSLSRSRISSCFRELDPQRLGDSLPTAPGPSETAVPVTVVPGRLLAVLAMAAAALWLPACDSGPSGRPCRSVSQCEMGQTCVSGVCTGRSTASGADAGRRSDAFGPPVVGDCTSSPPVPADEVCNGRDDDCDDTADEGVTNSCGTCDPSCMGSRAGAGGEAFDLAVDESEGVGIAMDGSIELDSRRVSTAYIWIANTGEGTVSKVDTRTHVEVARYRTGPIGGEREDPSRTTVNSLGDVFVANRGGRSVSRISTLGEDCPDTNGDGAVRTSGGPTDVLPWGQDDCILWNTSLPDGGILRSAAAQDTYDPDGNLISAVWIGGWEGVVWKLDGDTGSILVRTTSPTNNYGFALDGMGNLWISGRSGRGLGRIDTNRCTSTAACDVPVCDDSGADCIKQNISIPGSNNPYGITVDQEQRVWLCMHGSRTVGRYDPRTARWTIQNVGADCHGIAADAAGWIWAAGYDSGVIRLDAETPSMFMVVPGTGGRGSKGMAVDIDGNVWSINQGSSDATVITPGARLSDATVETGVNRHGALRYTYSDMTGTQLRLATNPRGHWRRPFEGCTGEGVVETVWEELRFDGEAPVGTLLRFRVRTAATREALSGATWISLGEMPPTTSPIDLGAAFEAAMVTPQQWIEVEVQLEAMRESFDPARPITPRLRSVTVTRNCPALS
jgi:streptogramin lyase